MRRPNRTPPDRGARTADLRGSAAAAPTDDKTTEIAAVRLLARREHSARELKRKLQHKGHSAERVDRVVDQLTAKKLVSDERFAANSVAYRARRGQGPNRIRAELRQQGATDEAIDAALSQTDVDWAAIACAVRHRKFGEVPRGAAERAKQSRFLQYRGFSNDHIRVALSHSASAGMDEPEVGDVEPDWSDSD